MQNQLRFLQIYAGILTIAIIILLIRSFSTPHFNQLDAKRINIVEDDGTIRMTISNQKQQHPGAIGGKPIAPRERPAGIIFFNNDGDECGGLVFDGNKKGASMTYSVDQFQNDQIMQMSYSEDSNRANRAYGVKMWDRNDDYPLSYLLAINDTLKQIQDTAARSAAIRKQIANGANGTQRLYLGKTTEKEVGLFLRDSKGILRLSICVDSLNRLAFQTFDSTGKPRPTAFAR